MEYTLADAAKAARVNKSTMLRAVRAGRVSARREGDGTYRIDASELARVYDLHHVARGADGAMNHDAPVKEAPAPAAPSGEAGVELAVLRAKLDAAEDRLAREREDRERERLVRDQEREEHGETVRDLRRRLDRAEERVLALTVQPAPQPVPEPSAVVEDLRRRLQESEARNQMLSAVVAPQWPEERLSEAPAGVTPPKGARGFLGRLLGR